MAANRPILTRFAINATPGLHYSYSGGGYVIVQQMIEDATGMPFARYMRETVLDPIGMLHSRFQQPLDPILLFTVAQPVDDQGRLIPGGPHIYPEMAAAGLWTTPTDLATWVIEMQQSLNGKANHVLTPAMTRLMLTNVSNQYGLGVGVVNNSAAPAFTHTGGNEGYRDIYFAYENGDGAVIMTSGDNGDIIFKELLRSMAQVYHWPDFQPLRLRLRTTTQADFLHYTGTYTAKDIGKFEIRRKGNVLEIEIGERRITLFAAPQATFFAIDTPDITEVRFRTADTGSLLLGGSPFSFSRL